MTTVGNTIEMVNFSPGSLDFGTVALRQLSAPQEITFVNSRRGPVEIANILITGNAQSEYDETHEGANSIDAAGSLTVSVKFRPIASGLRKAELSIVFPDGKIAGPVQLKGHGE